MSFSTPVQAGTLNRVIEIQQRAQTVDAYGQQSDTWTTVAAVRASIEPLSGSEVVAAGAQLGTRMVSVVVRYRPWVAAAMRVLYEDAVYNVLSVLDDMSRHRKLTLLCSEGTTRG